MKHIYTFISVLFISLTAFSQGYQFGIVHNSGYNFSIVAIPDFDGTNTDISDIGFSLMLPTGSEDITNVSQFNGRALATTEVNAATLTGFGLGDGTRDAFVINLPPGQTILSHTTGQQIVIINFDVSNMPNSGLIEILLNTDSIAIGLGGAANSFYNSNIDATTTQDYFSGLASGMDNFSFSTLAIEDLDFKNNVRVYPNPTTQYINIESTLIIDNIELYDLLGKRILQTNQTQTIQVNHLPDGVYLLKIFSDNNSITKKIVKQ